jgi:hypothetical protein
MLARERPLPKIPAWPIAQAGESLSSWIERTACFYGCALDRWIGQFSIELPVLEEPNIDLDLHEGFRAAVSAWSALPLELLPPLADPENVLPKGARLAFCDQCWDEDVLKQRQPYVRAHWLNWATVHCAHHLRFLSVKNRSVDAGVPYAGWQEIWESKACWRDAFQISNRGLIAGSLWYRPHSPITRRAQRLLRSFERFADPKDFPAKAVLSGVRKAWQSQSLNLPVLIENRIEILRQAVNRLDRGCYCGVVSQCW